MPGWTDGPTHGKKLIKHVDVRFSYFLSIQLSSMFYSSVCYMCVSFVYLFIPHFFCFFLHLFLFLCTFPVVCVHVVWFVLFSSLFGCCAEAIVLIDACGSERTHGGAHERMDDENTGDVETGPEKSTRASVYIPERGG